MKKNIIIIVCQYSVVVKGMEQKLTGAGFNVEILSDNYQVMIKSYAPNTGLFLLFLPGDMSACMDRSSILVDICKTIDQVKANMIILGEKKDEDFLIKTLPELGEFPWYYRPIDVNEFKPIIKKAIEEGRGSGARKRILIVDDDPAYAAVVEGWLEDHYRVDIVNAGMQAITFLLKATQKVDLILLDYEMPVVDGPQVLQMLRQEPSTADIPVLFLTGVGDKESVSRAVGLKPDGYILKTATKDELLDHLKTRI